MAAIPPPPSPPRQPQAQPGSVSQWGLKDAAYGWVFAIVFSTIAGAIILSAAGYANAKSDDLPLWLLAITQVPLWVGLVGAPLYAARGAGHSLKRDFGFSIQWSDLPLGIVVGVLAQVVMVPLVSWPWLKVLGKSPSDISQVADKLAAKATDPLGVVLLIAIVAVGAPIVEELFYRGLLLRGLELHVPEWAAVVLCGLIFGASHFELLQLPALAVFGMILAVLAIKKHRLGPSIVAHLAFNGFTVWYLLK